jgi:fibronectin type 3 domain-containing protein
MHRTKHISSILACVLFIVCSFLSACGKKGPPTLKAYEKPPEPAALRAEHRDAEIIVSWDFPKNREASIKGFEVFKSSGGDFEQVASLENDKRTYRDRSFQAGSVYQYRAVSRNLKGIVSENSSTAMITPETLPPPPSDITFSVEYDSITLHWKSAGENISYSIFKSHKSGEYSFSPLNKEPVRETSFKDVFDTRKPVYYVIRSVAGANHTTIGHESEELSADPAALVPSAPEHLDAVATEGAIYLIWREPRETWVTGYRVYRERDTEGGFTFIGAAKTPSFIDRENPSLTRSYRVSAVGPAKEGPPAEIRNIVFMQEN